VSVLREVKSDTGEVVGYSFLCAACTWPDGDPLPHVYYVKGSVTWDFDGNLERPTFSPSLKNTNDGMGVCHLFVKAGQIEYCPDCTHKLAGKTVPMLAFPV
jgi:hypothetical protein